MNKDDGYLSLLDNFTNFESAKLEFLNMDNGVLARESYTAKEMFTYNGQEKGKELRVSSFSFGTTFFTKIIQLFDKSIVLCGYESIIPYSIKHSNNIQGLQKDLIKDLVRNSNEQIIIDYIKSGKLELYVPIEHLYHNKGFLMNFNDIDYRIYLGSANMSDSAHSVKQGEFRLFSNKKENYDVLNELFENTKNKHFQRLKPELYFGVKGDSDYLEKHPEEVPFNEKGLNEKIIYIDTNYVNDDEEEKKYDFRAISDNMIKLEEDEKKLPKPKQNKKINELIYNEDYVKKVCTFTKQRFFRKEEQEKIVEYPILEIDYYSNSIYMNGKEYSNEPSDDDIKKCFDLLKFYFDGIDKYTTELDKNKVAETKKEIFKFMIWAFLSVFIGKIRFLCDKFDAKPIDIYPKIGFILGEGSNGKTGFIKILTKLITGQILEPLDKSFFTREALNDKQLIKTCCPIIFDDIDKAIDGTNFEKLVKDDVYGVRVEKNNSNYSPVIFTTNKKVDISKDQIIRRVFFSSTQCRKLNIQRLYNEQYNLEKTIEEYGNIALFSVLAYKYILPKINEINDKYINNEQVLPSELDFYNVMSSAIIQEYKRIYNIEDIPQYFGIYTINDLRFIDKASEETKKKICNWLITIPHCFEEKEDFIVISDINNSREIMKLKFPPYLTIHNIPNGISIKKNELEQFLDTKIILKSKKKIFGIF